jgi:hypothetical protein
MYSEDRIKEIQGKFEQFYLGTKILALVAMLPFLLITNAFLCFSLPDKESLVYIIIINSISFVIFLLLVSLFQRKQSDFLKRIYDNSGVSKILKWTKGLFPNTYVFIVFKIFLLVILFDLAISILSFPEDKSYYYSYLVAVFIFLSSVIVFRLLFYSNEKVKQNIRVLVDQMLSTENRRHSKILYRFLIWLLVFITAYYYFVPSLETTNALYILLIVFSFFIIYLDYWRNAFRNKKGFLKVLAFIATVLFLVLPFLSPKNQYRIPFIDISQDVAYKPSLEESLKERLELINRNDSTGNLYIICAMGGGSRAGYIQLLC